MAEQFPLADFLDFGKLTDYRRLELPSPSIAASGGGLLELPGSSLEALSRAAFEEIAFRFPRSQLEGFAAILADGRASEAERFVAASLLRNAAIAAEGVLPICQDTGTAIVYGWKGAGIITDGGDEEALAAGARAAYVNRRLRASQLSPTGFLSERNTGTNLPIHVDLRAAKGGEYRLVFAAKGGGSTNKAVLSMETPALLDEKSLEQRLAALIAGLGASACPPYRISLVLGGQSPEEALHVLALAGLGLLDGLPRAESARESRTGSEAAPDGFPLRSEDWEGRIAGLAAASGVGAQFGGSRLALDARAIRLPRHAASLPLAFGVACAANRRAKALVRSDGIYLEKLEADPARFLPRELPILEGARRIDLDRPLPELAALLSSLEPGSPLLLSGTVITARDAAHARFRAALKRGEALPGYLFRHPVFYAGPTEAAPGEVSGSFGPTTAGRMDGFLGELMERGAALVTIAKGSRSAEAAGAIAAHGGAYLATMGGAAALAARENLVSSEVIDHADLGMEAVRRVVLRELPAILVIDGKGGDFYRRLAEKGQCPC